MGKIFSQLPPEIKVHIKAITKSAGLPETEESHEQIAQGWLEKKKIFEEQIGESNMIEVENLAADEENGAVALTYSGSLILIGPLVEGVRKAGYNSIGIRKNVPDSLIKEGSKLAGDITINAPIKFEVGPVKSTSSIFKIAVCKEDLGAEEQEDKISEVTVIMTNEFVDINKALVPVGSD
ncbi:MAG: hypothetical protein HQ517_17505 [SAR324 cluster bacterium]|nr:hypothetical protein [SAR324 cluster bacterium]